MATTKKAAPTPLEAIELEINALQAHHDAAMLPLLKRKKEVAEAEEQRNAVAMIQQATKEAYNALERAQELALKYDLSFDFSVKYGMGGTFNDKSYDGQSYSRCWESSSQRC